jgi:ABC-2 type transport system permease protein
MMYLAAARLAFQRQLAYRTANLAGLATNIFFGALRAYVLIALFGAQSVVAGYSLPAAITYTGLTQALLSFLMLFGWWDLMRTIRTGDVASDLSRPFDFFGYWWAQDCGRAMGYLILRGLPIMILYAAVYRLALPPTPIHWAAAMVSISLALFISFCYRFIVNLAAFWTQDAMGIGRAAWMVSVFLSGFLMPIAFLPPWFGFVIRLTPFAYMVNTPVEIFLGIVNGPALWAALGAQAFWCVALYALARLVLGAGVNKLVIQGG